MRRRTQRDQGFTLVELLMAITISSIVVATIAAAIVIGLRTTGAAADRMDESHDAQLISTYLIPDLQSAQPSDISIPGSGGTGCSGANGSGTNVMSLMWTEQAAPTSGSPSGPLTTFHASYWLTAGPGPRLLVRYGCNDFGNPGTPGQPEIDTLARDLASVAPTKSGIRLILTLTEVSGYSYTVSGSARIAGGAVPEPLGCGVTSAVATPNPATRATGVGATSLLAPGVAVAVRSYGTCSTLQLVYTPNLLQVVVNLTPSAADPSLWTKTLPADLWSDGVKPLQIRDSVAPATVIGTINLTVGEVCAASAIVTPTTIPRSSGTAPTTLSAGFSITATSTGACTALSASFNPNGTGSQTLALTQTAPGAWSTTVAANAYTWTEGTKTVAVSDSGGPPLANPTLTVTAPPAVCTVTSVVATPNPATRQPGTAPTRLGRKVNVTATVSGPCTTLTLVFSPNLTGGPQQQNLTQVSATTWMTTIARDDFTWTDGSHTLAVKDALGVTLGSVALVVQPQACSVSNVTPPDNTQYARVGTGNKKDQLQSDITVQLTPSGCGTLTLSYDPGISAPATDVFTKKGQSTQYSATADKTKDWSAGPKSLEVLDANGDLIATVKVTIT